VNMSKEGKLNSSSEGNSHDKWNIEGDKVKLHEAISRLRTIVSGENNAILYTYIYCREITTFLFKPASLILYSCTLGEV
jgi:hypothetical protein